MRKVLDLMWRLRWTTRRTSDVTAVCAGAATGPVNPPYPAGRPAWDTPTVINLRQVYAPLLTNAPRMTRAAWWRVDRQRRGRTF